MALATFEERAEVQVAGIGAKWKLDLETVGVLQSVRALIHDDLSPATTAAAPRLDADPLDAMYARLSDQYLRHAPVRARGGGLPGELTKL